MKGDLISREYAISQLETGMKEADSDDELEWFNKMRDFINALPSMVADDNFGMMMNLAVRYALGRMTYAVSSTVDFITPLIPNLSNRTLHCFDRDMLAQQKLGLDNGFGDPAIDEPCWMNFWNDVRWELATRSLKANPPDASITEHEMFEYGYKWEGMLPMRAEMAFNYFELGIEVYAVYEDNTESLVSEVEEITIHAEKGGLFGVQVDDWLAYLDSQGK